MVNRRGSDLYIGIVRSDSCLHSQLYLRGDQARFGQSFGGYQTNGRIHEIEPRYGRKD